MSLFKASIIVILMIVIVAVVLFLTLFITDKLAEDSYNHPAPQSTTITSKND